MTKGPPPTKPRPPRPLLDPGPVPPPTEDQCSASVVFALSGAIGIVGAAAVAVPNDGHMLLFIDGHEVGDVPEPWAARLLDCSSRGWLYSGAVSAVAGLNLTIDLYARPTP
jgi:hypothetical protein